MKKSTPTPASASLVAIFFHAGFSVVNSLRSASVPWILGSSRIDSCPGPQVGKLATEQTTLPPVGCSADRAALSAGNNAGSGFLICWKRVGIRCSSDVITDLVQVVSRLVSIQGQFVHTSIRTDPQTDPRSMARTAPPDPSLPSSVPDPMQPALLSVRGNLFVANDSTYSKVVELHFLVKCDDADLRTCGDFA